MDIMVEFHSMWQLLPAIRIARALAPYGTYWHEDPIRMDSLGDLRRYAEASPRRSAPRRRWQPRWAFRDLLETGAAGIVMLDVAWCGGLSEARKIAAMAEAWHLPVAPHDCTGPVVLTASTHLSLNAPNALIQESVRAFYRGWYRDVVTACPRFRAARSPCRPGRVSGSRSSPISRRAGRWRGGGRQRPISSRGAPSRGHRQLGRSGPATPRARGRS
jgi:galactonate dehydratase